MSVVSEEGKCRELKAVAGRLRREEESNVNEGMRSKSEIQYAEGREISTYEKMIPEFPNDHFQHKTWGGEADKLYTCGTAMLRETVKNVFEGMEKC